MSKILVTGGLGYIGSHTVVELINAGFEPKILDQITKITGRRPVFHQLDLSDEHTVKNLATADPDIAGVIHFAAFKAVGESVQQPLKYYRNNIYSLINLLDAYYG